MICFLVALLCSEYWHVFDKIAHMSLQVLVGFTVIALYLLAVRHWKSGLFIAVFSISMFFVFVHPISFYFHDNAQPTSDLFFMNTYYHNDQNDDIITYIKQADPATVALVEPNNEILQGLSDHYPEWSLVHRQETLSLAVFSRHEPLSSEIIIEDYPYAVIQFESYTLLLLHPAPPTRREKFLRQQEHFAHIRAHADQLVQEGHRIVIAGDFNSTAFSGTFKRYFVEWYQSRAIYTWQTPSLLMMPIDYIVSNDTINVTRGPNLSSDHAGLHMSFE